MFKAITQLAAREAFKSFKQRFNQAYEPARRLRLLVQSHGLAMQQLLHVVPKTWKWTISNIKDDDAIVRSLDGEKIAKIAKRFGVRHEWLEGIGEQIYEPIWGYKHIDSLIRSLSRRGSLERGFRMCCFVRRDRFEPDRPDDPVLVFSFPLCSAIETAQRHVVCGENWDWRHWPCRRDLKAVARWAWLEHHVTIPIVPLADRKRTLVRNCVMFPGPFVPESIGGFDRLEDHGLTAAESQIAVDDGEARHAAQYLFQSLGR